MNATQNLVHHEAHRASGLRRSVGYLAALVLAACLGLGAHLAFADTVTTAGHNFTATSSGSVMFKLGPDTVTCTASSTSGTLPSPPNNPTSSGVPVCGTISPPTFTGCTTLGIATTITSSGSWQICLSNHSGSPQGRLKPPVNGVSAAVTVFGSHCTARGPTTSGESITGAWTNGSGATKSKLGFSAASVSVVTTGGFPCPSASSVQITGTYNVTDTTSSTTNVIVGP
jgi:hypothetical protein